MKKLIFAVWLLAFLTCSTSAVVAQEPGWSGPVIAFGQQRAQIESTPIVSRNYRPFHFYGNTVRRRYYRGTVLPSPGDVLRGSGALARVR
jgi:hypothetical protein